MTSGHPQKRRLLCLAAVAAATSLVLSTAPAGAQSTRSRLEDARRKATQTKAEYERIAAAYAQTARELDQTRTRLARTKSEISRTEDDMVHLREHLKDRVRTAYRMRGVGFFQFLLEAESFRDFQLRLMTLQRQTLEDEDLVLELRKKRYELDVQQAELAREEGVFASQKAAYEEQGRQLTISLQQANQLVQELRDQLSREEIERLFRISRAASGGPAVRGTVISLSACPVGGPRTVSNDFGAPRGGGSRRHQGNDILAPHGAPIVAVLSGTVTRTGSGGLGGLTVYLWANGISFYYAHLSSISVSPGQQVSAGQTLGANGDSGNARGGPPHLHFEIKPGGGRSINPYPSLVRVC